MNRVVTIAGLLAVAMSSVPFVGADGGATMMNCKDAQVLGDEAFLTVAWIHLGSDASVWEETNGIDGLQTESVECREKHDANGKPIKCGGDNQPACATRTIPGDSRVA